MKYLFSLIAPLFLATTTGAQTTAKEFYEKGLELKKAKKSAEAIQAFKEASQKDPTMAAAIYEMGWCYNDTRNYTSALSELRKVRPMWPKIPKVYFELGWAFGKLNLLDSAEAAYKKCQELKPDYSGVTRELGYIAYERNQYEKAVEYFKNHETVAITPITSYLFWYRKGFSYNALKQYEQAKPALNKSLEFKTDYINTYLELGFACSKLKQNDEAISWFNKAILVDPKSHIPYNGIAEVYRDNIKNMEEAMTWYKKALGLKKDERKACFGMGYCLNSQSKYSEAIPYLETAIKMEDTYTAAYVELGYSYYKTGRTTEAETQLNLALKQNPKNENARYYAVLVYIQQKNKTKAQQMVNELKALNSKYTQELQEKVNKM